MKRLMILTVVAALAATPAAAEKSKKVSRTARVDDVRVSGNVITGNRATTALPGVSGHVQFTGPMDCNYREEDCGMVQRFSVQGGWAGQGTRTSAGSTQGEIGTFQARAGVGVLEDGDVYYMPVANFDVDTQLVNGVRKTLMDGVYGAELGKVFGTPENAVIVGAYSGVGMTQGKVWGGNQIDRVGLAAGVSVTARLGKANTKGTQTISGTAAIVPGGSRSDANYDYNLANHIRVGAAWRHSQLRGIGNVNAPAVRASVAFGGP